MQPLYFIIHRSPQITPLHVDYADESYSVSVTLIVWALLWVMRVEDAKPLQKVQYWFQDGADTYLAERSKKGSAVWICTADSAKSMPDWARAKVVDDATAALDEYCDFRLDHGRLASKHTNLPKLRENRDAAAKLAADLGFDLHNTDIGFFRRYRTLEQLYLNTLKAQRVTSNAERTLLNSQTLQCDLNEALKQIQEMNVLNSKLTALQEQARSAFAKDKNSPMISGLHCDCARIDAQLGHLQSNIDDIVNRYRLGDLAVESTLAKVDETVARQEQELADCERQHYQAEHDFEVYRRWLRANSVLQRAEELAS
ncbi:hypothetical protein [Pseudidiomarina terrestris]|uniref:hypothetical protein n=1 Tax=Pseudidiomarina terrestris TaxID=2820060 RepID=UPI00264AE4C9|nr:hypothetical protein [Pseudidiomarina sp. 1ASP75-5]MDN7135357.1 hypothetical protein [Pseudidiomarina sp. 1ASP75-5]